VAAQTLSFSVAAAIYYLRGLKLPKFRDSKQTTEFIMTMNNLFDVFNLMSKFGKVMKAPLTPETKNYVNNCIEYLKTLTDATESLMVPGKHSLLALIHQHSPFSQLQKSYSRGKFCF